MVAAYTEITVANPRSATATGTVTITDPLPAGLTATAVAGKGWTCEGTTCHRSDPLPGHSAYPPIRVVMNVAANAPERLINAVSGQKDVIPARDACPYGWSPDQTVAFGKADSKVRNQQSPDGCTILDRIWDNAPFASHGAFVSTVERETRHLGPWQRAAILMAAVRSDVGTVPEFDNSCANRIAFTFDDGTSSYRPKLLQVLRDKQVHATFFDNGVRVEANPQWARFQAAEGHVELNHTYSHVHMDQLTPEQNTEEVVHNERVLAAAGAPIPFKGIRPPFGGSNPAVQKLLIELGYTYFLNRIDGADWLPDKSAAAIRDDIVAQLKPGVIIGMHDGPIDTPAGAATVDAVGQIIDKARSLGYCFGVVDVSGHVVADRYVSSGRPIPPLVNPVPYRIPLAFGTEEEIPPPWVPIK
ncbi:polysaccharide deacetylase family protein [Actinocrispum sp. NPDC049592]|uniref:polysaccharide deacetylase family protein n=1 Tax=Actinocrispum sp. NPDC049592 TaxID=3154835 RepID=UPI00343341E5